jgi:hypothetical protein
VYGALRILCVALWTMLRSKTAATAHGVVVCVGKPPLCVCFCAIRVASLRKTWALHLKKFFSDVEICCVFCGVHA